MYILGAEPIPTEGDPRKKGHQDPSQQPTPPMAFRADRAAPSQKKSLSSAQSILLHFADTFLNPARRTGARKWKAWGLRCSFASEVHIIADVFGT